MYSSISGELVLKKIRVINDEQALHKLKTVFSIYQPNFCTVLILHSQQENGSKTNPQKWLHT